MADLKLLFVTYLQIGYHETSFECHSVSWHVLKIGPIQGSVSLTGPSKVAHPI